MKISVVTASYNYAEYIEETIQSVLNQTYNDWEMIIVDDGSSDNSIEVIQKYAEQDSRIKLFTHENNANKGLKETLLLGIEKATGDWIVFLESDDMLREDYLEKKIEIAKKYPDVGLIFNDAEFFGDEDRIMRVKKPFREQSYNKLFKKRFPCNIFKEMNIHNRILSFSVVMVKKDALFPEYFNTPVDKLLDWWLYIHLLYKNDVYYIPEKLTLWRMHKDSYIKKKTCSKFHCIQIRAYIDIYKKSVWNLKLLMFVLYTVMLYFFIIVIPSVTVKSGLVKKIRKKCNSLLFQNDQTFI